MISSFSRVTFQQELRLVHVLDYALIVTMLPHFRIFQFLLLSLQFTFTILFLMYLSVQIVVLVSTSSDILSCLFVTFLLHPLLK